MNNIFVLCLFLTACSSDLKPNTCYVKWTKQEYKYLYKQGLGKTREEKCKNNLLFPIWKNGGIYIKEKGVIFDISDENGDKYVTHLINSNMIPRDHYQEEELYRSLMGMEFKVDHLKLEIMIKEYEQVDCEQYEDSEYL